LVKKKNLIPMSLSVAAVKEYMRQIELIKDFNHWSWVDTVKEIGISYHTFISLRSAPHDFQRRPVTLRKLRSFVEKHAELVRVLNGWK